MSLHAWFGNNLGVGGLRNLGRIHRKRRHPSSSIIVSLHPRLSTCRGSHHLRDSVAQGKIHMSLRKEFLCLCNCEDHYPRQSDLGYAKGPLTTNVLTAPHTNMERVFSVWRWEQLSALPLVHTWRQLFDRVCHCMSPWSQCPRNAQGTYRQPP